MVIRKENIYTRSGRRKPEGIINALAFLGACQRIGILVKIETFPKNKHSHMFDIGVYAYLRALFFGNNEEFGQNGILGQAPDMLIKPVTPDALFL